ncbi:MAG: ABC transporter, partial [Verrucomicrobiota bacterium]
DDGGAKDGGRWVFGLEESAAFMGVQDGDPPIGENGEIKKHWKLTSDWWKRFGFIEEVKPPEAGIDLTPIAAAAK